MLLGFIFGLDFFFFLFYLNVRLSLKHTTYATINAVVRCGNEPIVEMCVVMCVDCFKLRQKFGR